MLTNPLSVADLRAIIAGLDPSAPIALVCHTADRLEIDSITVDSLTGGIRIVALQDSWR
jgi:hypothetical protein